mgnify:CR=1 FL=1
MGTGHTEADIGGTVMKFVLYGRYDPRTYVAAYTATDIGGCGFSYLELDCDPVLIAFSGGREVGRTHDVAGADDWVNGIVFGMNQEDAVS